ncbi:MAG TPA: hypothetical protein VLD37_05220 [Candidatus Bilamarchaeum sp.]|nr:hypothetical protein [Candidatus Bilamarchaeum sp.]
MAGPRRRPAETQTPQLSEDEVRNRAQRSFDSSLNAVIQARFSARPPAAEIAAVRRMIDESGASDITPAVRRYSEENPNSVIARYFSYTSSTGWLLTPTGTVGFNPAQLAADVRAIAGAARQQVASSFVSLFQQSRRQNPDFTFADVPLTNLDYVGTDIARSMVNSTNGGPNAVPVFIASERDAGTFRIALKESTQGPG